MLVALLILGGLNSPAQPFSSGSDGSYGPLVIGTNTTLDLPPDGIFRCTSIIVSNGATLKFNRNALNTPVYLLATSNVIIAGVIDVSGESGTNGIAGAGKGGPGGFDGGKPNNGNGTLSSDGLGPGAGQGGNAFVGCGSGAYATPGSTKVNGFITQNNSNVYGNSLLIPLIGGSGGGGQTGGSSGCGGGGAILIASDTSVNLTGSIRAIGGGDGNSYNRGYGSGGAIRIVAPTVMGTGSFDVHGGSWIGLFGPIYGSGGDGRIRIDSPNRFLSAFRFFGSWTIGSYMKVFPDIIPRLDILEAAGQAIPEGANAYVSVTLPVGSSTNQTVRIQARDFTGIVPIKVVVTPDNGPAQKYTNQIDMATGNPAVITVNVVIPVDTTCQIHAWTR